MKRITLFFSIALIVIGIIGRIYAAQASYVDVQGMLHDSMWLPIGTLMIVIGVLALIVLGLIALFRLLKKK